MKSLLIRLLVLLAIGLLIFLLAPKSAAENKAHAETQSTNEQTNNPPAAPTTPTPDPVVPSRQKPNLGTDLKSDHKPDPDKLKAYLEARKSKYGLGSPLAPYASQIAKSDFWALLIGICTIEQYDCTHAPAWNFWGMMKPGGGLRQFATAEDAISFMDSYFTTLYPRKSTVESLRGYYCASACTTWEPTVLRVKRLLESSM